MQADDLRYWGKARPSAPSTAAWHLLAHHYQDVAAVGIKALRTGSGTRRI